MTDEMPAKKLPQEFVVKVNDILAAAARIEKRYDTGQAHMVLLHAFAWQAARHYLATIERDDATARQEFGIYLGELVAGMTRESLLHIRGPAPEPPAPAAE